MYGETALYSNLILRCPLVGASAPTVGAKFEATQNQIAIKAKLRTYFPPPFANAPRSLAWQNTHNFRNPLLGYYGGLL